MNDDVPLRREAACFACLLCGAAAPAKAIEAYVDAHSHCEVLRSASPFQEKLVRHASRSVFRARIADGYARFFDPRGPLRHKLVLMLAILECTPPIHRMLDTPVGGTVLGAAVRLTVCGLRAAFCIMLGTLFFVPLRLFTPES